MTKCFKNGNLSHHLSKFFVKFAEIIMMMMIIIIIIIIIIIVHLYSAHIHYLPEALYKKKLP